MPTYEKNATLVYRKDLNPELSIIRVKPDEGVVPEFAPGQYAELAIPDEEPQAEDAPKKKMVRRSYSIASAPKVKDALEFYVVLVEDGALTPKLWDLKVGDRLWLGPKIKGKFTIDPMPKGSDAIMVSTGTGLAPFLSMLEEFKEDAPWNRIVLIHGVRLAQDLGYKEDLEKIAEANPNVIYIPMCTREPEDSSWAGPRGRVNKIFESSEAFEKASGIPLDPEKCHVFLCGNPAMIDTVQEQLEGQGFKPHKKKDPGNIHFERYW